MTNTPFFFGLAAQAGQIVAFGAQNLFVLRQGLSRRNIFCVIFVCVLTDLILVAAGIYGTAYLADVVPAFVPFIRRSALVFLGWYGARCFLHAFKPAEAVHVAYVANTEWVKTGMQAAAVSFLNPHVWLDAFVILGSLAQPFTQDSKNCFFLGAMMTSLIWFAGLGYSARLLSRPLSSPVGRRVLDLFTGLVMWSVAAMTVF